MAGVASRISYLTENHFQQQRHATLDLERIRTFHSSPAIALPVRRRRRTLSNDVNESNAPLPADDSKSRTVIKEFHLFEAEAEKFLDKFYQAILPMKKHNEIFILDRGEEAKVGSNITLDLGPSVGAHTIQVDLTQFVITYSSPVSGQHSYELVKEEGNQGSKKGIDEYKWQNISDRHDLEGIIVRDLLRSAGGCPKL